MAAKVPDVRKTVTSDFKAAGDLIYQLGATYDELGASEFYALFNELRRKRTACSPRSRQAFVPKNDASQWSKFD